jgi:hypothetical protein
VEEDNRFVAAACHSPGLRPHACCKLFDVAAGTHTPGTSQQSIRVSNVGGLDEKRGISEA